VVHKNSAQVELIANWLVRYYNLYRIEADAETVKLYVRGLDDCTNLAALDEAFLRAMKHSKFRPNVAVIREEYDAYLRSIQKPYQMLPPVPITPEERREEEERLRQVFEGLGVKVKSVAVMPMSEEEFQRRKAEHKRQAEQLGVK